MLENGSETYRLNNSKLTYTLWCAFGTFVVVGMASIYFFIVKEIAWEPAAIIALNVGCIIAVALLTFFLSKNTFIKFKDSGFEIIKGSKTTSYTYDNFQGTKVTRHYYNGVYTGTTRLLKVMNSKGKTTDISCNGISKESFSEIVAHISKSNFEKNIEDKVPAGYFENGRSYVIPRESILKKNKTYTILYSLAVGVVGIALLALWISASILEDQRKVPLSSIIGIVIIIALIIFGVTTYLIVRAIRNNKSIQSIPERITIHETTITIDEDTYTPQSIANISMLPGNYKILSRDLLILMKDGSKVRYNFGDSKSSVKRTYSEYSELYDTLKLWCLCKGINFISILG